MMVEGMATAVLVMMVTMTKMMLMMVIMSLFRRSNRERVDQVRVDRAFWHIAGSVA